MSCQRFFCFVRFFARSLFSVSCRLRLPRVISPCLHAHRFICARPSVGVLSARFMHCRGCWLPCGLLRARCGCLCFPVRRCLPSLRSNPASPLSYLIEAVAFYRTLGLGGLRSLCVSDAGVGVFRGLALFVPCVFCPPLSAPFPRSPVFPARVRHCAPSHRCPSVLCLALLFSFATRLPPGSPLPPVPFVCFSCRFPCASGYCAGPNTVSRELSLPFVIYTCDVFFAFLLFSSAVMFSPSALVAARLSPVWALLSPAWV